MGGTRLSATDTLRCLAFAAWPRIPARADGVTYLVTLPPSQTSQLYPPLWTRDSQDPGDLCFDTFEAEFTHEGDRCTFEVLLSRFVIEDPALRAIAEIVHDIDIKDGKFGRQPAPDRKLQRHGQVRRLA